MNPKIMKGNNTISLKVIGEEVDVVEGEDLGISWMAVKEADRGAEGTLGLGVVGEASIWTKVEWKEMVKWEILLKEEGADQEGEETLVSGVAEAGLIWIRVEMTTMEIWEILLKVALWEEEADQEGGETLVLEVAEEGLTWIREEMKTMVK